MRVIVESADRAVSALHHITNGVIAFIAAEKVISPDSETAHRTTDFLNHVILDPLLAAHGAVERISIAMG